MRAHAVLICLLLAGIVAARAGVTSASLIGHWTGGSLEKGNWVDITFLEDHTFHGSGRDTELAGKWKLHDGKKLELIYYRDYERKIISDSSKHAWIIIESFSNGSMRLHFCNKDVSPAFRRLPSETWRKKR